MMKILSYILIICLIVIAGCGGCGSTKSSMATEDMQEMSVSSPDNLSDSIRQEIIKEKVKEAFSNRESTNNTTGEQGITEGVDRNSSTYREVLVMRTDRPPLPHIQTPNGTLVYKIDSVLTIGVVSRVEARIIKRVGQVTTEQLVQMTTHTTTGVIRTEIIKVGDIMDMSLVSLEPDVFTITSVSSGDQPVDDDNVTEWLWGVKPNKVGSYDLILKAIIKENGVNKEKIVFDKKINVQNIPKIKYMSYITVPSKLVRYEENIIKFDVKKKDSDTYIFEWGGDGVVKLEFDEVVKIVEPDENTINDNKTSYNFRWVVIPGGDEDSLHFYIKILGEYEDLILYKSTIHIDKNIKGTFEKFIDGAAQNWYWLFSTLLIPLYMWIKKKYFPEKQIFRRKRKKPTPKT